MSSVTDEVSSVASSDSEEHSVETYFEYDDADADVKLVSMAGALDVIQSVKDEGVPTVISISPHNEARDDVDVDGDHLIKMTDERERTHANETNDKEKQKKKSKQNVQKASKRNTKTKGVVDAEGVISTLNKNITSARHHKSRLADSNTLISPPVDDLIDNFINSCDPVFEASYKATCNNLLKLDVGNEEPDDDSNKDYDQLQSKIDKILSLAELHGVSSEKDDMHNFDLSGVSVLVNQKREIDDLIVSKGLVDAKLQESKAKLRDAMNAMALLQEQNNELQQQVQTLEFRMGKKDKKAEHAMRKEQEMSQNYLNDLDRAHSTIERLEREKQEDMIIHRKALADVSSTLKEETQNNEQLNEEILSLKQQLVAERSKRHCIEELMHEKDNQNEKLRSELHQNEFYCRELEQALKMMKKGTKKDNKELRKINEDLSCKLLSSKEKLKRLKRERNELHFKLDRLNSFLRVEANTRMTFEEESNNLDLEDGIDIDDEHFLNRQSRRMERMKSISIMS